MNLNNIDLIKHKGSEIELIKWNGFILYQKNQGSDIHLYIEGEFKNNTTITEVRTMVNDTYNYLGLMFYDCNALTSVNTQDWDVSNVTDMHSMFYACHHLSTLVLNDWDTSNVTTMNGMFMHCRSLESLNLSNWVVSDITDMNHMFNSCVALTTLDLSNWETTSVHNKKMFYDCNNLKTIYLNNCDYNGIYNIITSEGFPTGTINGEKRKIYCRKTNAPSESELPDGWQFVYVTPYKGEFANNTEITEVTTIVDNTCTDLGGMFQGCTALTTVNTTEWDTSNVTTMQIMFYGCESLVSLDLSSFNTSKVTNMSAMFYQCYELQSLDLSYFDMSNVDLTADMLGSCTKLHTLKLRNCSNDTIRKIVTSYNFPSGSPIGADTDIRILYCKEKNADGIEELLPSGWDILFVD